MLSSFKQKVVDTFRVDTSKEMLPTNNLSAGIDIVFQNITYSVEVPDQSNTSKIPCKASTKQKPILKGISGIFKAGKVTAIMGASGAGKTTLLNILACRINPKSERKLQAQTQIQKLAQGQAHKKPEEDNLKGGKLYANNLNYNYSTFGDFANYVMQNDVLTQTLTVRQTLQFAAQLKLNLPEEERKKRVMQLAHRLKLEKCIDTMVGGVILKGVSGGQRKRTSIAFQLMSNPQVIFLDQPTSGLDSLTSYIIVNELRKLAHQENRTVIMTIHQPNSEIYQLFDNLTLLLEGKIIYHDEAAKVTSYFQKHFNLICGQFENPPDFVMSKIHYDDPQNRKRYDSYFNAYDNNQKQKVQKMIQQKSNSQVSLRQVDVGNTVALSALTHRSALNIIRNPMLIKSKLSQTIFMGLFIGGLYFDIGTRDYMDKNFWQSISGFLFFLTINAFFMALTPVSLTFPLEREVFFKQQDSKMYNVFQYFVATNIVEIPELAIIPLLFVIVYYFMIELAMTGGQFFLHFFVIFLVGFTGSSLGLLFGSIIQDAKSVSTVIPIVVLPIILFSGYFKNRRQLPAWVSWIQYVSPQKYGFVGLIANECEFKASRINELNFDVTKWQAIIILASLGIFFRLFSFFFLWLLRKRSQ